jgi:hypothetical protein
MYCLFVSVAVLRAGRCGCCFSRLHVRLCDRTMGVVEGMDDVTDILNHDDVFQARSKTAASAHRAPARDARMGTGLMEQCAPLVCTGHAWYRGSTHVLPGTTSNCAVCTETDCTSCNVGYVDRDGSGSCTACQSLHVMIAVALMDVLGSQEYSNCAECNSNGCTACKAGSYGSTTPWGGFSCSSCLRSFFSSLSLLTSFRRPGTQFSLYLVHTADMSGL